MENKRQIRINTETGRLDRVLSDLLPDVSRSQIQSWLREKAIQVNGNDCKSNYKVQQKDLIEIFPIEPQELELTAENLPLEIVYEDQEVAVINKAQGMVVHPSAGHPNGTMVNALLYHIKDLSTINDVVRPGIVHRIDKDTSGLLMVAKNDKAYESLAKQLRNKSSVRKYLALVHGVIPHEKGTVEAPIGRAKENRKKQGVIPDGKNAITHFTVLERFADFTLVECQLETGRTHQIRVHMQYIGYPLAGDPLYGPRKTLKGNGQFLHAATLGFYHPVTEKFLEFSCPVPEIFEKNLKELR